MVSVLGKAVLCEGVISGMEAPRAIGRIHGRGVGPCRADGAVPLVMEGQADTFSVWTQFTVPTGKRSGHPRGMPLVTRMAELQALKRTCVGSNGGILECKMSV
jgi:hypothetical protein